MVERNPKLTRKTILEAAFEEMYERGYQGMRLDKVLETTGLTKGALYHHFPNKQALALAVVDELGSEYIQENWVNGLAQYDDKVFGLQEIFRERIAANPEIASKGCPLNNLAQEMSSIDSSISDRLQHAYALWNYAIACTILQGQELGQIKSDINPIVTATYLISAYQGIIGTAKCMQSMDALQTLLNVFCDYIESLRA